MSEVGSARSYLLSGPIEGEVIQVGVDVISLERLARVLRRSPRLFQGLCLPRERSDWCQPQGLGLIWATLLWTSKEAAAKCLRTGLWRAGVDWPDLEVIISTGELWSGEGSRLQSASPEIDQLESILQRASQGEELSLKVSAHRVAQEILGADVLIGSFSIQREAQTQVARCLMHRERLGSSREY